MLEAMVTQFNNTYKIDIPMKPRLPTGDEKDLTYELIHEELTELNDAMDEDNLIEIADALIDIIYVTAQRAVSLGIPVDALLREVQRSNMSKLGADGEPIFRDDGKVIKGPNFSPPDIQGILMDYLYPKQSIMDFQEHIQ